MEWKDLFIIALVSACVTIFNVLLFIYVFFGVPVGVVVEILAAR